MLVEVISIFLLFTGLIIGLGAVTVIDIHGFLARKSSYWTEATTRTHKITKPLIWIGLIIFIIGSFIFYNNFGWSMFATIKSIIIIFLILNGVFLSFVVSPFLLNREKQGQSNKILPQKWQNFIFVSFIISFIGWWSIVLMTSIEISNYFNFLIIPNLFV